MNHRLSPGDGLILCSLDRSRRATLPEVQFSYPLKLIVPNRRFLDPVQVVWVIGYGGGLVAGDRVRLKVKVEKGSTLVLLTQGSTKVYKTRQGRYLSDAHQSTNPSTIQLYRLAISPTSLLILLPSPVTCFSQARYEQKQVIHLEDETSSLILLDWFTSGRMGYSTSGNQNGQDEDNRGEAWEFERYRSENEIWLKGERITKDVLLLQDEIEEINQAPSEPTTKTCTTYRHRVEPYSCYASLFLFGPQCEPLTRHISKSFLSLTQYKQPRPYSLIWSYSPLEGGGGIARCAGHSTEAVKEWVCELLSADEGGIESLIGKDLWKSTFS